MPRSTSSGYMFLLWVLFGAGVGVGVDVEWYKGSVPSESIFIGYWLLLGTELRKMGSLQTLPDRRTHFTTQLSSGWVKGGSWVVGRMQHERRIFTIGSKVHRGICSLNAVPSAAASTWNKENSSIQTGTVSWEPKAPASHFTHPRCCWQLRASQVSFSSACFSIWVSVYS